VDQSSQVEVRDMGTIYFESIFVSVTRLDGSLVPECVSGDVGAILS